MQNGRKVQNSPTILFLSQLLYNVNLMTLRQGATLFLLKLLYAFIRLQHNILQYKKYCQNIKQWTDLLFVCLTTYQIDHYIGDDSHCDTLGDAVHERHCDHCHIGRDCLGVILEVYLEDRGQHQKSYHDQGRCRCKGRDSQEDRRQEQGQCEQDCCYHCG